MNLKDALNSVNNSYGYTKRVIESMWGSQGRHQRLRDISAGPRKSFVGGAKKRGAQNNMFIDRTVNMEGCLVKGKCYPVSW